MNKYTYNVRLLVKVIGGDAEGVREHIEHSMCLPWDHSHGHNGVEIVSSEIEDLDWIGAVDEDFGPAQESTLGARIDEYASPDGWGLSTIYTSTLEEILESYGISLGMKRGE